MRSRKRGGLALVELVTVSAMFLLLVAFQLPAFMRSRETARRAQCTNNMKQIALATFNYESTWGTLPMSNVIGAGHGNGHGCFTAILPFLEQSPLWNTYNTSLENWHAANVTTVGVKMSVYLCPANPTVANTNAADIRTHQDKPYPGKSVFAPLHYGANWGGVREASGLEAFKAYPGSNLGVMMTVVDPDAKTPTRNIKIADIIDGTSNTAAFVERLDSFGWAVGGWGGTEFDVNTTPFYEGKDARLKRVFTGSHHPAGVNFSFCDGSVRFLRSNIDRKVWYALTTRAGGEVVKLD